MSERVDGPVARLRARGAFGLLTAEWTPAVTLALLLALHGTQPALAVVAGLTALFVAFRLRAQRRLGALAPLCATLFWLVPTAVGAAVAAAVSLGEGPATRAALASALTGAWCVLALGAWQAHRFNAKRPLRCALIGEDHAVGALATELDGPAAAGLDIVGRVGLESDRGAMIGTVENLRRAVLEHRIDMLVLAGSNEITEAERQGVLKAAVGCIDLPVRLIEGDEAYESILGHVPLASTGPSWIEPMLRLEYRPGSAAVARARDLFLVIVLAPIALALLAVCAAAVALTEGLPIFHRQRRIGAGGREFTVTKLRSMRDDVEGDRWWAQEDDPRVTPIGRFLRRFHLDELPQMWNVLKGEMSLVGPRPEVPDIVDRLEKDFPYYDRRHLVKPGITGWAQVRCGYAGSNSGSAWKLCFDLYYLKHRSFVFDLLIMVETLRVVFAGGQYGLPEPDARFIAATPAAASNEQPIHLAA